jgi:hypothetical protein
VQVLDSLPKLCQPKYVPYESVFDGKVKAPTLPSSSFHTSPGSFLKHETIYTTVPTPIIPLNFLFPSSNRISSSSSSSSSLLPSLITSPGITPKYVDINEGLIFYMCIFGMFVGIRDYVESVYGSVERCRAEILQDFFKHAFDGSGGSNPFEVFLFFKF